MNIYYLELSIASLFVASSYTTLIGIMANRDIRFCVALLFNLFILVWFAINSCVEKPNKIYSMKILEAQKDLITLFSEQQPCKKGTTYTDEFGNKYITDGKVYVARDFGLVKKLINICIKNGYEYEVGKDLCDCHDYTEFVNVKIKGKWHTLYCLDNGGFRYDDEIGELLK